MKKRTLFITLCFTISITVVLLTLIATNTITLPSFLKTDEENISIPSTTDTETADSNPVSAFQFADHCVGAFLNLSAIQNTTTDALLQQIISAKQIYADTFFIDASIAETIEYFKPLLQTELKDCTIILVADSAYFTNGEDFTVNTLKTLLDSSLFDAIAIEDINHLSTALLTQLTDFIKTFYPALSIGGILRDCEVSDDVLRDLDLSFICAQASSFKDQVFNEWAENTEQSDCRILAIHDSISSAKQILDDVYRISNIPFIYGQIFSDLSSVQSVPNAAFNIAGFYYKPDSILKVQKINLQNNSVSFSGSANSDAPLHCNTQQISTKKNAFSHTIDLLPGENNILFSQNGKNISYSFYTTHNIIAYCSPCTKQLSVPKDETITIYAVCITDAIVTLQISGNNFSAVPTTDYPHDLTIPDGYSVFSCNLNFSEEYNYGAVNITAIKGNDCHVATVIDNLICNSDATITTGASLIGVPSTQFRFDENQSGYAYSPYSDNGLPQTQICKILTDDTEQIADGISEDVFSPLRSSLPHGCFDYVDKITESKNGYILYKTRSGATLDARDAQLITNGYTMPDNVCKLISVQDDSNDHTTLTFSTLWPIPAEIQLNSQEYKSGYAGYKYNISDFTSDSIDITLPYTFAVNGLEKALFNENSVVLFANTYTNEIGTTLQLKLREKGRYYGCNIQYDSVNSTMTITIKKNTNRSLVGKTIMIDPGHGGYYMTGTALADNTVAEKEITLAIGMKLKNMLENRGANVIMTRTQDIPIETDYRRVISTTTDPDLFISLHCDGIYDSDYSGTHSFYFTSFSQPLAACIHKRMVEYYRNYIYTPANEQYDAVDYGVKYYPFAMIRSFQCPSVLVEMGFMTNETEGYVLTLEDSQYWIAEAITMGIQDYLSQ